MLRDIIQEAKKNGEVIEPQPATCPHCRQMVTVDAPKTFKDKQLSELAEEYCNCGSAQFRTKKKARYEKIEEKTIKLFGPQEDDPLPKEALDAVMQLAKQISNETLGKATINTVNGEKIKIYLSKGTLVLVRETKTERGEMV